MQRKIFIVLISLWLSACATVAVQPDPNRNLKLVVTDLVSAVLQIKELNPVLTTLQMSEPSTEFGKALLTAFEDAGYGIQMVSADQGTHYVSYAVRSSETEAGDVNDYLITINDIEIRREYNTTEAGIYPASLMYVTGSESDLEIQLSDAIFAEQGGDETFLSGVERDRDYSVQPGDVREVVADGNTRIVADRRTQQQKVLEETRMKRFDAEKMFEMSDLSQHRRYKRVVMLFPDNTSLEMGEANKTAVRMLIEDFQTGDIFEIKACDDVDGTNLMSERRAIRVKEEFVSYGVPVESVYRAPCVRANYRHGSDDSPTPVAIFQYRTR